MADGFLQRYNEELAALRRRASGFAAAFPKIAGRLRMTGEVADDPHVERLIQSFAYSAARVRQKLDDDFPELTDGLLETLYPHYLAPIPSMSVVRFEPSGTLAEPQIVPRHTEITAEPVGGEPCRFRTTQNVEIAPVTIARASLGGQPIQAPLAPHLKAAGCFRISIRPIDARANLADIGLSRLRFYIPSPWRQASMLYELLVNHRVGIALARHTDDREAVFLAADRLRPVGFEADEAMLPYPVSSFAGYRLLTEFFALPQKFLFFEIDGLDAFRGEEMEIFIYLDETDAKLERSVSERDLCLHATPVVNLYRQSCEPVPIDGTRTENRLLPDSRRQKTREIHTIERVLITGRDGRARPCHPFFGRSQRGGAAGIYWQAYRRFDADDGTCDIDIAFLDHRHDPVAAAETVASIDTLCLNRDLPEQLPFGGGHPYLQLASGHDGVSSVLALIPPTAAIRLTEAQGRNWRLMSHLILNHLSLFDNDGAPLKDILSLYAFRDTPETRQPVDALVRVSARSSTARLGHGGMVPGTEIDMEFDPASIDRASAFLFGSVLDRFCGLYTSINSFTRLSVFLKGQSKPVARWPARAAARPLI